MPTSVLVPGTTPANSTDITVVAGVPVNVGAYRADGERLDQEFRGLIFRKDADGNYNPTNYSLNRDKPNQLILGPGVYQIQRSGNITTPTGVQTD